MEPQNTIDDVNDRVVDLLNDAIVCTNDKEKVKLLQEAQELVIHHDILDNFLDEVIAFQSDRSVEVRKFVVGFIEASCKKDGECFAKLIVNLNQLVNDDNPNVVKKAIQSTTQAYKAFLQWVTKVKITDEVISTWDVWSQIKDTICKLLDTSENEGVKAQCIKFLEWVVLMQTAVDTYSTTTEEDVHAGKLSSCKLFALDDLKEEATQAFDQLVIFHGTPHIQSGTLMACMTSLVIIAKQRSSLFMSKVIQALEALHTNLPPTLSNMQVNSVRKHLKLQLLMLLKHPAAATNTDHQTIIIELLQDLGATQSDINKSLVEVKKKGFKVDMSAAGPKRIKLEKDEDVKSTSKPSKDSDKSSLSSKISRSEAISAIDVTTADVTKKLSVKENVTDLVLVSLLSLPDTMPSHFQAAYTPISSSGKDTQVRYLGKLVAAQLTQAGFGRGVEEVLRKLNEPSTSQEENREQRIAIGGIIYDEAHKQQEQQEKQHHLGRQHSDQGRVKLIPSGKTSIPTTRVQRFSLEEITKKLDEATSTKMILSSAKRILEKDKEFHSMSITQKEERSRLVSQICSMYSNSDVDILSVVMEYVLEDMKTRQDILLDVLYDRFLASKKSGDITPYFSFLQSIIMSVGERQETFPTDRDHLLARLYLESPILPNACLQLLTHYLPEHECFSKKRFNTTVP